MARISQGLNPGELSSLGEGEHCDGKGLYLRVTGIGGRSWIVKYQWAKKQEKMGVTSGVNFTKTSGLNFTIIWTRSPRRGRLGAATGFAR
jgi:hypothetical protein